MGHFRRYRRLPVPRRGMGDLASTIGAAVDVASDPYLAEVVCRIQQLKNIDHGEAVTTCVDTPPGVVGGIGLRNITPALRAYVYAQQNTWVYPLAVIAILGIPMWIGYQLGRNP